MIKTLKNIPDLKGKRVFVRVDFNVPIENGAVMDDTRITSSLPTINYLSSSGAKVILATHLGRPDGKIDESLRLDPIAKHFTKITGTKIKKINFCVGNEAEREIANMQDGEILLLENIRFEPGEEECSDDFCRELAKLADIYVNDAFGTAHRKHASTAGIAAYLPAYAGFLMENEITNLSPLLETSLENLTLIMGGAKVDTKIGVLNKYIGKCRQILIGGALANTFISAQGYDVGASKYEKDKIKTAKDMLEFAKKKNQKLLLPIDAVTSDTIEDESKTVNVRLEDVSGNMKILDIGERTRDIFIDALNNAKFILWNGPMGMYEQTPFIGGTKAIAEKLANLKGKAKTYIGGGDTIDAIKRCGFSEKDFSFVSTGGGATLEFLEGKELPGIVALK